jgi:hypothetical protein
MAEKTVAPPAAVNSTPKSTLANTLAALEGVPGFENQETVEMADAAVKLGVFKKVDADGKEATVKPPKKEKPVVEDTDNGEEPEPEEEEEEELEPEEEEEEDDDQEPEAGKKGKEKKVVDDDEDDAIFGKIKKGTKPVKVEKIEDLPVIFKKNLGIEIKDIKDYGKVVAAAKKWRADAQKSKVFEKEANDFKDFFMRVPEPLMEALKAFDKGQDWETTLNERPVFDYSKDVNKMDQKKLVEHYFPGEFSKEDFEAEEVPKALTIAIKSSKDKFNKEKEIVEGKRTNQVNQARELLKARTTSLTGSVSALNTAFPDLPEQTLEEVKSVMKGGDVTALFLNPDGTWKPEAAERLLLALHGKKTIKRFAKVAENRAKTEVREEILKKSSGKSKSPKGGAEKTSAEVLKELERLTGGIGKKTKTY